VPRTKVWGKKFGKKIEEFFFLQKMRKEWLKIMMKSFKASKVMRGPTKKSIPGRITFFFSTFLRA